MAQLSETFPTLDCSYCILAPRMVGVAQHSNIKIITMAEPMELKGIPGDYTVIIEVRPRYVDETKCTGCDECSKVCPVEVLDEFSEGLELRKAIYVPFPQAVPRIYTIDVEKCIRCFKCVEACSPRAIKRALFVEGDDSPFAGEKLRQHVTKLKKELLLCGINPLRLQSTITTIPQYDKTVSLFEAFNARISHLGKISDEKRSKIKEAICIG